MEPDSNTIENIKQLREEASTKYVEEMEKLYYKLLEITFYKIKSILNEKGLAKVNALDKKRKENKQFDAEFSEETWRELGLFWQNNSPKIFQSIIKLYRLKESDIIKNYDLDIDLL